MKKIISVIIVVIAIVSLLPMALAAGLNAYETKVLKELKSGAQIGGKTVYLPDEYIKQAENYFNAQDLTKEQAAKIEVNIAEGKEIIATLDPSVISSSGVLDVSEIPESFKAKIVTVTTKACDTVGLSFSLSGNVVKIVDETGNNVFTGDVIIKNTGLDNYVPYVIASIVLLLVFSFAIAYRVKFK